MLWEHDVAGSNPAAPTIISISYNLAALALVRFAHTRCAVLINKTRNYVI
jgi:hypothetical protein